MPIEAVSIDFAARGVMETLRAFDRIEERIVRMERAAGTQAKTSSRQRVEGTKQEVAERERSYRRLQATEEKTERDAARNIAREQKRAQREEIREHERTAKEIERIEQWKMRVRIRSSEMAGRLAAKEAAEEIRNRERIAARYGGMASGGVRGFRGKAVGGLSAMASGGKGLILGAMGIGGGFLLADAVRNQLSDQKQAALLVNAVTTGAAPPAGASVGNILALAGQQSKELGVDRSQLIGAALEYSRKARGGDFGGAIGNMGFFAKMAKVTGADINEVAGAAGILQSQNQSLNAPAMQQMLLDVYAQGKQGSMSMVDVAKQIGVLGSPATSFAGNQADVQRKLLGLGQLAAPQGTIEEAGTFIKDLVSEAASHRRSTRTTMGTEAMGVKFDKFGRMESPEQMIEAVMRSTKGDVTKIEGIFGKRGTPLFRSLLKPFTEAGGGEAGIEAVRKTMAGVTTATMTSAQLDAQNAVIDATDAQKFTTAINSIENTLMTALAPALTKFAKTLTDHEGDIEAFIKGLSDVAGWFLSNPLTGLGTVVLASVTNDLAAAGIGAAVKSALLGLLSGASGGGGIGGAAAGLAGSTGGRVLGALGAAGLGAGLGVAAGIALTDRAVGQLHDKQNLGIMGGTQSFVRALQLERKAREGTLTPADIASAQRDAASATKQAQEDKAAVGRNPMGMAQTAMAAVTGQLGPLREQQTREQKRAADESVRIMQEWTKALEAATKALNKTAAHNPARNGPMPSRADPRHI